MQVSSPFVNKIIEHWENNFPKQAEALKRSNQLLSAAEEAAKRTGELEDDLYASGLSWTQVKEMSVELWGTPPSPE